MPVICAVIRWSALALTFFHWTVANAEPAVRVVIADAVCGTLGEGADHANVAYQGGVDAYGRPVVPADVAPESLRVPMPITFDVSIDVAERLGLSSDIEAMLNVAQVSERDGEILINGEPAGELGRDMARSACLEAR